MNVGEFRAAISQLRDSMPVVMRLPPKNVVAIEVSRVQTRYFPLDAIIGEDECCVVIVGTECDWGAYGGEHIVEG